MDILLYLFGGIAVFTAVSLIVSFQYYKYICLLQMRTVMNLWKAAFIIPFVFYAFPQTPEGEGNMFQAFMFILGILMICITINFLVNSNDSWDQKKWTDREWKIRHPLKKER